MAWVVWYFTQPCVFNFKELAQNFTRVQDESSRSKSGADKWVPVSPFMFSELSSCEKVEVAILVIVSSHYGLCGHKATLNLNLCVHSTQRSQYSVKLMHLLTILFHQEMRN